ncbi:WD40 repeat, partial [Lecanosticta acicola]
HGHLQGPPCLRRGLHGIGQRRRRHRLCLIKEICPSFSTSILYDLHNEIGSMVYFDPVRYLPNELILVIFSYLSPKDLLTASLVSRPWRERTQDEKLWHDCFGREGWVLDRDAMGVVETQAKAQGTRVAERKMRTDRPETLSRKNSRKRPRDEAFNSENESTAVNPGSSRPEVEADLSDSTESMEGVEASASQYVLLDSRTTPQDAPMDFGSEPNVSAPAPALNALPAPRPDDIKLQPSLFTDRIDMPRVSWPYLYKHRRRLEKNWETGKYTMFRLPDPNHEEEGHQECVYTIQHHAKWLVSGSRDKTIRIWDLDRYRLRGEPLRGHAASVLCLQFDDKPGNDHDIIVSGGSDHYVIVWRFSTGEQLRVLKNAHAESVLNLRFDDRYLVTCSKDKTIKIWNRHEIARDSPIIPHHVLNFFNEEVDRGLTLPAFTELTVLTGHQAAVNAVQISGDTLVSASGDRSIKSWDIHTGNFVKSYSGHTKGIACVQFDGRRIVSGSSDNSVRIFDYDTTAEVACLDGHNNLVRTVQARFGDLQTITDEELLEESKQADFNFLQALEKGMKPADVSRRRQPRNAGSSRPEDMLSFGTKVPPGGGGSKWAKIVSGSYDETVIIWKRGKDGKWRPNQRLHQGMLLNHPSTSNRIRPTALPQPVNLNNINVQAGPNGIQIQVNQQQAQQLLQQAQNSLQQVNTILRQPPPGQAQALPQQQLTAVNHAQQSLNAQIQALASQQHQHAITHGAANTPQGPAVLHAALGNQNAPGHAPQQVNNQQHQAQPTQATAQPQPQPQAQGGQGGNAVQGQAQAHHHHQHHHHHHNQQNPPQRESNRVFKLQFDARRIIACSQNKVIVGWDFAAGDQDLEWVGNWSVETP